MDTFEKIAHKYPKIVKEMCSAAISAGARIMDVYSGDDFGVEIKRDESPVTLADKVADKVKLSNYSAQKSWKKLFNGKDLED